MGIVGLAIITMSTVSVKKVTICVPFAFQARNSNCQERFGGYSVSFEVVSELAHEIETAPSMNSKSAFLTELGVWKTAIQENPPDQTRSV